MVPPIEINYMAVLVAAIASMVVGMLWYGPLFGKQWMKLMGFSEKQMAKMKAQMQKKGMGQTYTLAFLGSLVMSYVLAHIVDFAQAVTVADGAQAGFWVWLGFIVTTQLNSVLWEGKPRELYGLNVGHYLVALVVMGIVLTVWV